MKRFLKIVSLFLIFSQVNINYVAAGNMFFKSEANQQEQKIKIGYKFKFGQDYKNTQEKLAQNTAGGKDLFDSPELGGIAFLIILMLIFTAGRSTAGPSSVGPEGTSGDGGGTPGEVSEKFKETAEEIQTAPQVSEADIPSTNVPTTPTE